MPSAGVPSVLLVPVAHDIDAVGIERRHHQHDRLRANLARLGVLAAHEPVREHERGEDAAHLIGVNARGDEHDQLSVCDQRVALARPAQARIGEATLNLAILWKIGDVRGVRDDGGNEGPSERRLAERVQLDARTRLRRAR